MFFATCRFIPSYLFLVFRRKFNKKFFKVTVLGAAGNVGQPLSLLLKKNKLISNLSLYDINHIVKGVACDTSHCSTSTRVYGYCRESIGDALNDSSLVIILAGCPPNQGRDEKEHLKINAKIVRKLTTDIVHYSPTSLIAVVTDPVNSLVPMISEIMRENSAYDPRKIFGVTTVDILRASKLVSLINKSNPKYQMIPVVGGHSTAETIIPLLSQASPGIDQKVHARLVNIIQNAEKEMQQQKETPGSSYLATAYATARFTNSLLHGLVGDCGVVEYAYVRSCIRLDVPYFAGPILLGPCGIDRILPIESLNESECDLIHKAVPLLIKDIYDGISCAHC